GGNCSERREYTNEELKVLIQSLVDHAQRHGDGNALPRYYRSRTVRWVIKIDQQGEATLIDSSDADNKSGLPQPCPFLTRTSGIAPMLLVDTLEYAFALPKDGSTKAHQGAGRRHDAYRKLLTGWRDGTSDRPPRAGVDIFDPERRA